MANAAAAPVSILRDHATELEAALSVCLAEPTEQAVHKVRTQTRRIEAQLELLGLLKGLPSYKKQARKTLRQLKKLRRAAGRVRDLDVAQKLIEDDAEKELAHEKPSAKELDALRQLRNQCRKSRKRAARRLLQLLKKRQLKISAALEELLHALKPAEDMKLPVTELLDLLEQRFKKTHALIIRDPSTEHLHSIRKAAKIARYMAENARQSATAKRTARRFEDVQEAGGEWHDWLDLADAAAGEFGEKHAVTTAFTAKRDLRLATYKGLLDTVR